MNPPLDLKVVFPNNLAAWHAYQPTVQFSGLDDEARLLMLLLHVISCPFPVLVIASDERQLKIILNHLSDLAIDDVAVFPKEESIPFEVVASSGDITYERLKILARLQNNQTPRVLITTPDALSSILMPPKLWRKGYRSLALDDEVDIDELILQLIRMGYHREEAVSRPGEFSLRGGILDVFSPLYDKPLRIEFFDTSIDSIRTFEAETQRSIENVSQAILTPGAEIYDRTGGCEWFIRLEELKNKYERKGEHTQSGLLHQIDLAQQALKDEAGPNATLFKGAYFEEQTHLLDYYRQAPAVFNDDVNRFDEVLRFNDEENQRRFTDLMSNGLVCKEQWDAYFTREEMANRLKATQRTGYSLLPRKNLFFDESETVSCQFESLPGFLNRPDLVIETIKHHQSEEMTVISCSADEQQLDHFQKFLQEYNIQTSKTLSNDPKAVHLVQSSLTLSGIYRQDKVVLLPVDKVFLQRAQRKRDKSSIVEETVAYHSADAMSPGDYVVHENHGIGMYTGLEHVTSGSVSKDYLVVQYAGTDKLFVPVEQFDLLQKYVGHEGRRPKLNKLSGTEWQRTKKRVQDSVADLADYLISIYAEREEAAGHAYPPDDEMQYEFEQSFPYVETEDQLTAINDVKRDMMKPRPMDRLICGDVGYGKTEIAIRAAFKAVADGKQVAILVPTTVLAQQHYDTFKKRFDPFGVRIAVFSRFSTTKEAATIKQQLKDHQLDIVIGTHKLLNKRLSFSDLGLLVVDEEQRFGVVHKERIKEMKNNIDVLTLSATPIPRTLHLSLAGIRDMSIIETPPADRYPIQTYVTEFNDLLLSQAIRREMARGGQVYVIQNRIEALEGLATQIRTLVPDARVLVGHGRMKEHQLEKVMLSFVNREADVLVCTTIIETGLDIGNVNTLIVLDADRMGLSQLYQLRGRVGRSNRVAYAYLTFRADKMLTDLAEQRLHTLKEYTALGSGYRIAMRDLELRGAGNLLGAEQHGHVYDVGFDMYMDLLSQAVAEKRGLLPMKKRRSVELDLRVNAYIPEKYIVNEDIRLSIYKRLERAEKESELEDLLDEIIDRFGDIPSEALALVSLLSFKLTLSRIGVKSLRQRDHTMELRFYKDADLDIELFMTFVHKYPSRLSLQNKKGELVLLVRLKEVIQDKKSLDSMKLFFENVQENCQSNIKVL